VTRLLRRRAEPPDTPGRRRLTDARSHVLREVGLARHLSRRAVRRARIESLVLLPALAGVLAVYDQRAALFSPEWDRAVRLLTAIAMMAMGWQFAGDVGRALGPLLFRRLEPASAGTVGFLLRPATVVAATSLALRVAGLTPHTLAFGGALSAVVVGLAAQQTLGNLFAGTTFAVGDDAIMVPNSVVLNVAIVPLREPDGIDLRARLRPGLTPLDVQELLQSEVETPMRETPRITLEELDGDEVVVRISATPERPADGPRLASEVLEVVGAQTARADA